MITVTNLARALRELTSIQGMLDAGDPILIASPGFFAGARESGSGLIQPHAQ